MFKWSPKFSCNVKEIDLQHQKLFELGSSLHELLSLGKNMDRYDEIMRLFDELYNYTVYHFEYEEALMKQYNIEGFEEHKQEHENFIAKVNQLSKQNIDEKQSKVLMDMIIFVSDWITEHILKSDFKYKETFNANGVY